jgi:hypothetical protein
MSALTFFLSPRRGHRSARFLIRERLSGKSRRTTLQKRSECFTFSWGEKAGMRADIKTILHAPATKSASNFKVLAHGHRARCQIVIARWQRVLAHGHHRRLS